MYPPHICIRYVSGMGYGPYLTYQGNIGKIGNERGIEGTETDRQQRRNEGQDMGNQPAGGMALPLPSPTFVGSCAALPTRSSAMAGVFLPSPLR